MVPRETPRGGERRFLLAEGMAPVKQASPELVGCQRHAKERSISPTCVRPLINEVGDGEGPPCQMLLPLRLILPAAAQRFPVVTLRRRVKVNFLSPTNQNSL